MTRVLVSLAALLLLLATGLQAAPAQPFVLVFVTDSHDPTLHGADAQFRNCVRDDLTRLKLNTKVIPIEVYDVQDSEQVNTLVTRQVRFDKPPFAALCNFSGARPGRPPFIQGQPIKARRDLPMTALFMVECSANSVYHRTLPSLGALVVPLTSKTRADLKATHGVVVTYVLPKTPAAVAGVQAKDVLLKVDGKSITDPYQVEELIVLKHVKGNTLKLTLWSSGAERTVKVTL